MARCEMARCEHVTWSIEFDFCLFIFLNWIKKSSFWSIREFELRVIRQTANARQRKVLRHQAINSKWTCCFKTAMHDYSFDARKKIWNENVQRKFCPRKFELAVCRSRCHRRFAPQEIRPPLKRGGDIPRIFAPRGESPRNIAPQGGEFPRNIAPQGGESPRNIAPL